MMLAFATGLMFILVTGIASWFATWAVRPWLMARATVYPNERSSHARPTPQGSGLAVVPVCLLAAGIALYVSGSLPHEMMLHIACVGIGALALMLVGLLDDVSYLPVWIRLAFHVAVVAIVIATLPSDMRIVPGHFSFMVERILLFIVGVWFINLYNFMDGIDLMSVTETVFISIGILVLATCGIMPAWLGWVSAALLGAMLGFSPWNTPPARLFLGDAGSLAIGLLIGILLVHIAGNEAFAAALILPLYYLMDAGVTLVRRMLRSERIWESHRDHFYQVATSHGFSVIDVVVRVGLLNAILVILSLAAAFFRPHVFAFLIAPLIGTTCTLYLLRVFSIGKQVSRR